MIDRAIDILRHGGLVAFPTETVYGLGADATNATAIEKVFAAKGRPATNPLIVHVADESVARRYARQWPAQATQLAGQFWPGPLTLVLPKTDAIVPKVTAGRDTVALRAPDHPLTLQLLRAFDGPLAGPSANRSTHLSPTTAQHVRDELGGAVDLILDGGPCSVGIESTVLDLTTAPPRILRLGAIARQQIESLIGPVDLFRGSVSSAAPAASPGQQEVHYAPRTPAFRFDSSQRRRIDMEGNGLLLLGSSEQLEKYGPVIAMPTDPAPYAYHLYAALRQLDAENLRAIYIEMPPDTAEWAAIRDRIHRATRPLSR